MAASAGAWYRVGKVNVTNDNQSVVGVDTNWQNDVIAIAIGDIFTLDAKIWYEVTAVNSDTSITLDRGFEGSTGTDKAYAIVRNTSGTILTRIAGQVSVQFNQKQLFLDELRTWLNSDNASEELTDSHGLKQSLKTPSQMVRDHDNKLAELDAINPHPYAMRKVDFEANRAANNEKFAASGFVHFGKYWHNVTPNDFIGEGLYTDHNTANTLLMGRGTSDTSTLGQSKFIYPVVNIGGVTTALTYISGNLAGGRNAIKLPPAEDGTRTYDSATGVSVTHSTSAIAFASETDTNKVVTDRVDMWGFEAFLREINDADPFVYDKGLIQSLATKINGVSTVIDNVRPITYFAWYEGDESSRGKGVNWQTASEAQRKVIASDPENNIYFDDSTGKFYQHSVRGRSFAGSGNGAWAFIDASSAKNGIPLTYDGASLVSPQGLEDSASNLRANGRYHSNKFFNTIPDVSGIDEALFMATKPVAPYTSPQTNKAVNGECYFLVCGTVSRLNQGAYHPSFNPLGAGKWNSNTGYGKFWYESTANKPITSREQAFLTTTDTTSVGRPRYNSAIDGAIDGGSGRTDGRYYDAIYASGQGGVCRDMRYSAWGLTPEDFAEADLKVKGGEYRGCEALTKTYVAKHYYPAGGMQAGLNLDLPLQEDFSGNLGDIQVHIKYFDNGYRLVTKEGLKITSWIPKEGTDDTPEQKSTMSTSEPFSRPAGESIVVITYPTTNKAADGYTQTEVIGDPVNILQCDDLKDGWVGSWNPVIPDGASKNFPLTRKLISPTSLPQEFTTNLGVTWGSTTCTVDSIKNSFTASLATAGVYVNQYTTKAQVTAKSANSVVYGGISGVGTICSTDSSDLRAGAGLQYSLTSKVGTSSVSTNKVIEIPWLRGVIFPTTKLIDINSLMEHPPIPLVTPNNNSSGVKALNYNVVENQQGFINYAYTELKYDGDWGDDSKIHIADNQTTMLDTNGNTVKVGTARIVEPLGWVKNDK